MAIGSDGFDRSVPLPPGLKVSHIRNAIAYVEERADDFIEVYHEQANVFSGLIGILGVRALDSLSPYKRHKHPDVAQQRFPDLSLDGKLEPPARQALESKGSTRPWALQSHYDHPGWYIVWRYAIDPTKRMKRGRAVLIWRVDIPFIRKGDWKYETSKAAQGAVDVPTHSASPIRRTSSKRRSFTRPRGSSSIAEGPPWLTATDAAN
jgi:hypothetical protein